MSRKGLLDRVRRGIYTVRPLRAAGRPWSISALTTVEQALHDQPHYIGGLAALTIHRLTEQLHASVIDVFITQRRAQHTLPNAKVRFHRVRAEEIAVGLAPVMIEHVSVKMSDPEKTLVDALNHPSAFSGIAQGIRAVDHALGKVDLEKLVTYALRLSPTSSLQRLGVLLERHHAPAEELNRIATRVRQTRNLPAMIPGPRKGPFNPRWRITENDLPVDGHRPATAS
jgi:predicted transcriptional regulator of viral defense system